MGADFLRRLNGLGRQRARGYLRLVAMLNIAMLIVIVAFSSGGVDANGFLIGTDFLSFWSVGHMLHHGANPYDTAAHVAQQRDFFASSSGYTAFFYPPAFLPFCWPLGFLGYFPALAIWLGATGAAYLLAVRAWLRAMPVGEPLWLLALAFPAVPIVVTHGQTSFLLAALLGLGAWLVPRRPIVAGVLFGLATIKPQFGLLVPVLLLTTREWKAIAAAALSGGALLGLSSLAFGFDMPGEWLAAGDRAREAMALGQVGYAKMMSVQAGLRLVGAPALVANLGQGIVTLGLVAVLARLGWRKRWSVPLASVMLAAAPLATPFVLDYDMVLLAFPLIWLTSMGLRHGFLDWEKLAIVLAFAAPIVARPLAMNLALPVMPPVLLLFFAVTARRAGRELAHGGEGKGATLAPARF